MKKNPTFKEMIKTIESYNKKYEKLGGKPWGINGAMIELSKQVGDLSKLVMMYEKYYFPGRDKYDKQYQTNKKKIGDELSDVLFAIVIIAKHYKIDLIEAYNAARKEDDKFLKSRS